MQVTESVVMDKEAREVGKAFVNIATVTKKALSDGWQPSSDLPVIVGEAVAELATKIADFQALPEMAKENLEEFIMAWLVTGVDMVDALRG